MNPSQLVFLHISDIHFRTESALDTDTVLQKALINDAEAVSENFSTPTGILITGDIAFSGQKQQYETATVWLEQLCARVGIGIESVRVIPGNHDVDRAMLKCPVVPIVRESLRKAANQVELDSQISRYLEDPQSQEILMRPTSAYNEFASALKCDIPKGKLWWEEDFTLNDNSILRIRGLHSALVSDHQDTDDKSSLKMVLGSAQVELGHEDGVAHLIMCHHPFDWLRFSDSARQALNAFASIQLFGHKHRFELNTINDRNLHLSAGAMQPDKKESGWEPRYNFLGISIGEKEGKRVLQVEVWPRIWNNTDRQFNPDYSMLGTNAGESKIFALALRPWRKRGQIVKPTQIAPAETPMAQQT